MVTYGNTPRTRWTNRQAVEATLAMIREFDAEWGYQILYQPGPRTFTVCVVDEAGVQLGYL
jgi:hypothetical protein